MNRVDMGESLFGLESPSSKKVFLVENKKNKRQTRV